MIEHSEPSSDATGALSAPELIETLELGTASERDLPVDVNALAAAVDPRTLGSDDLRRLLASLTQLAQTHPELGLAKVEPHQFARLVARASKVQLEQVVAEPTLRAALLDEVFARMSAHIRPGKVRDIEAVVHWRFTGGEHGYERFETVIADGTSSSGREMRNRPRVTITLAPIDFFKLITHQATAAVLFVTGKIKVKGDLAFAAGLIGFFDLPAP